MAAVLSHVGLFGTVHTCLAVAEAWLWIVGCMQKVWVQGAGMGDDWKEPSLFREQLELVTEIDCIRMERNLYGPTGAVGLCW